MIFFSSGIEGLEEAFQELRGGPARAAAIVGAALIESQLDRALKYRLHEDANIMKDAFGSNGPLATFSSKIKMAYLIGIYGKSAYNDFNMVRKIRNEFAHKVNLRSFDVSPIQEFARNLTLIDRYVGDATDGGDHRRNDGAAPPPVREWKNWYCIQDRDKVMAQPRQRFENTLGVLSYGLSSACRGSGPPEHHF